MCDRTSDPTQHLRLPHCTTLTRHSPLCDRDGEFCSQDSSHSGECTPHGSTRRDVEGTPEEEYTRAMLEEERQAERQWLRRAEEGGLV